jgi:hypothetical protein
MWLQKILNALETEQDFYFSKNTSRFLFILTILFM